MSDDIDPLSAAQHAAGQDALDVAVESVALLLQVRDEVIESRDTQPETFPLFGSVEADVVARRIVGRLLDAGWRPPSDEAVAGAAASAVAASARFKDWLSGLDDVEKLQAMSYFSEHGEFPNGLSPNE